MLTFAKADWCEMLRKSSARAQVLSLIFQPQSPRRKLNERRHLATGCNEIPQKSLTTHLIFGEYSRVHMHSASATQTSVSRTPIRSRPVDPPACALYCHPEQSLWWCPSRMVVQRSGALVKTACMPRVRKSEPLKIEVVAELVAERAQECSERGDLSPHRRPHPHPNYHAFGSVISKKLYSPVFANSQRPRCKHADTAGLDIVEL